VENFGNDFSLVSRRLGTEDNLSSVGFEQVGDGWLPFFKNEDFEYPDEVVRLPRRVMTP